MKLPSKDRMVRSLFEKKSQGKEGKGMAKRIINVRASFGPTFARKRQGRRCCLGLRFEGKTWILRRLLLERSASKEERVLQRRKSKSKQGFRHTGRQACRFILFLFWSVSVFVFRGEGGRERGRERGLIPSKFL